MVSFFLFSIFNLEASNASVHLMSIHTDVYRRERQNNFKKWLCTLRRALRMCNGQTYTVLRHARTYHFEEITGINWHIYGNRSILKFDPSGWKGSVTYGLGADISFPHSWQRVSETCFRKRSPGRNLGEYRLVRRLDATSTGIPFFFSCSHTALESTVLPHAGIQAMHGFRTNRLGICRVSQFNSFS